MPLYLSFDPYKRLDLNKYNVKKKENFMRFLICWRRKKKPSMQYSTFQTWVLSLYVIKSKAPSGGMKDIVLSFSKRANRTHLHFEERHVELKTVVRISDCQRLFGVSKWKAYWWNLMSSKSIAFPFVARPCASSSTLSFRPSLHSGIPL